MMKIYLSPEIKVTEFLSDSVILSNSIASGDPIIHPTGVDNEEYY